ncbi:MAG TPA: sulfite exporter TauE/SafE family protein [Solirubrobacteraceae bacterium]|jgi:hypothetical protein|nr:sulfite exporter TauE/SafE family protein [Solirubrobacteraceae bacterium]
MAGAAAIGLGAGVIAGLLGVGGGILFVPALVLLVGLHQVDAEATSLLAIVPGAMVGTWRQHGYGNVVQRDALLLGGLSAVGVGAGVALANVLPARVLQDAFAVVTILVAVQLGRRALRNR